MLNFLNKISWMLCTPAKYIFDKVDSEVIESVVKYTDSHSLKDIAISYISIVQGYACTIYQGESLGTTTAVVLSTIIDIIVGNRGTDFRGAWDALYKFKVSKGVYSFTFKGVRILASYTSDSCHYPNLDKIQIIR